MSIPASTVSPVLRILSLGAGVQSTTVYLMSLFGDLPRFDHVIFSDTGWEPSAVYDHLERLKAVAVDHGQTIEVVTAGNIRSDHVDPPDRLLIKKAVKFPEYQGKQRTFIPFFIDSPPTDKNPSGKGRTFRTCTKTYKIEPVEKRIRAILGLTPGQRWPLVHRINQTLGISYDESQRMRMSDRLAIVNEYPLIDMKMTRDDCHEWMAGHGWTAPRSACIGCPFHRNDEWRRMRADDPEAWADAINFDVTFRQRHLDGLTPISGVPYLHDSRVALGEANIDEPVDSNQGSFMSDTMFGASCEGFCGT